MVEVLKPFIYPTSYPLEGVGAVRSALLSVKVLLKKNKLIKNGTLLIYRIREMERFYTLEGEIVSPTEEDLNQELSPDYYLVWTFKDFQVIRDGKSKTFGVVGKQGELLTKGSFLYVVEVAEEFKGSQSAVFSILESFPRWDRDSYYPTYKTYWERKKEQLEKILSR